jgi:hypothetical protein
MTTFTTERVNFFFTVMTPTTTSHYHEGASVGTSTSMNVGDTTAAMNVGEEETTARKGATTSG